jgi:hypothetical protein
MWVTAFKWPNDPLRTTQWHLEKIATDKAWDVTTGNVEVRGSL